MSDPGAAAEDSAQKRKRVSACISCYHAKTKCTGEIPCGENITTPRNPRFFIGFWDAERCKKLGRRCEPQLRGPGRPSKESRAKYERAGVDAFIKFARTGDLTGTRRPAPAALAAGDFPADCSVPIYFY